MFDKYELIDSIIKSISTMTLSGPKNWLIAMESIQKLDTLNEGLRQEDAERDTQIEQLMKKIQTNQNGGDDT